MKVLGFIPLALVAAAFIGNMLPGEPPLTPEQQKFSKYICGLQYEHRRFATLGIIPENERAAYLRMGPVGRDAYWSIMSGKYKCTF